MGALTHSGGDKYGIRPEARPKLRPRSQSMKIFLKTIDNNILIGYNESVERVSVLFEVEFYRTEKGEEPVLEYMKALAEKSGKDSRIKLTKIRDYVKLLSIHGTQIGQPYIKHIDGDLWELRPLRDRILFFCWNGERFVLLHHFMKATQKTPQREIEQAKRNMLDYLERSADE